MDEVVSTLVFKVDTNEARDQMDQLEKKTESLLSTVEKVHETLSGFDNRFPWENDRIETEQSPIGKNSNEDNAIFPGQSRNIPTGENLENTFPSEMFRQWESSIEKILQSTNQRSKQDDRDKIRMYDPLELSKKAVLFGDTSEIGGQTTPEKLEDRTNSPLPISSRDHAKNEVGTAHDPSLSPSRTATEEQSKPIVTQLVDRLEKSVTNLLSSISMMSEGTEQKDTSDSLSKRDNDRPYLPTMENIEHSETDTPRNNDRFPLFPESSEITKGEGTNDLLKNLAMLLQSGEQGPSGQESQIQGERLSASRNESLNSVPQEQGLSTRIESAILEMDRRAGEIVQLLGSTDGYLRRLASTAPNETIVVKVE